MLSNTEEGENEYDDYDDSQVVSFNTKAQDVPPAAMIIRVNNSNKIIPLRLMQQTIMA